MVDGKGAARVISAMRGAGLQMRRAEEKDCRMFWEWANDPEARAASFSQAPIPWEEHVVWFDKKRNDPQCCILVATEAQGLVIGQFRVDWLSGEEGEVDVSVAPAFRGRVYGTALIDRGVLFAFQQQPGGHLHEFVKLQNVASRRAFEDAGFQNLGEATVKGHPVIHYIRGRPAGGWALMPSRATQAKLLEQRIAENTAAQGVDLTAWIFERLDLNPGARVLELCWGREPRRCDFWRFLGTLGL